MIHVDSLTLAFRAPCQLGLDDSQDKKLTNVGGNFISTGADRKLVALSEISFKLSIGQRLALLGHNGAGKTTLLRVLAGAYPPTSGVVRVSGTIQSMIDITLGIEPDYTARETIELRKALLGISTKDAASYLEAVYSISELGPYLDMPIRTYSTGMLMRLAFAMAYVSDSDILLMDEWLAVGDPKFRAIASELLQKKIESTRTVVLATHDEQLAKKLCSHYIFLEHGKIREQGKF